MYKTPYITCEKHLRSILIGSSGRLRDLLFSPEVSIALFHIGRGGEHWVNKNLVCH